MEVFEDLIVAFGRLINLPLHLDKNGGCTLDVNEKYKIQIEVFDRNNSILIASHLTELPPGKFRENVLKDALKMNDEFPRSSTLAYSHKNNKLSLFTFLPLSMMTPEKLASWFQDFLSQSEEWRSAVDSGQTYTLLKTPPPLKQGS